MNSDHKLHLVVAVFATTAALVFGIGKDNLSASFVCLVFGCANLWLGLDAFTPKKQYKCDFCIADALRQEAKNGA